jgi:hypothetical protein
LSDKERQPIELQRLFDSPAQVSRVAAMREIGQAVATSRQQAANLLPAMTKLKTVLAAFAPP